MFAGATGCSVLRFQVKEKSDFLLIFLHRPAATRNFCVDRRDRDSKIVAFAGLGAFPIMLDAAEGALPRDRVRRAGQTGRR
jgi:hypothetical protein